MKKSVIYFLHAIIVSLFLAMLLTVSKRVATHFEEPYLLSFLDSIMWLGSLLGVAYVSYFVFIPKYLIKKEYWKFTLSFLAISVGFALVYNLTAMAIVKFTDVRFHFFIKHWWHGIFLYGVAAGIAGTCLRLFIQWIQDSYDKKELESKNIKSELTLLKNQLNPHFLFNTLNNIDALIIDKSDNASPALNKLSDLMRYMVYDSEQEMVALQDEIDYLQNYISLQQLRMPNQEIVKFTITGDVGSKEIPPMLFIPYVENAFKHSSLKGNAINKIEINIEIKKDLLCFRCFNIIANINKDKSSGVGLGLVKKRLDLLYKNKYTLDISNTGKEFVVNMELKTI